MLRKLVIAAVLLALLAGVATVAWQACGMPPLRLVLKYGYPSPMGPTGRSLTIEGVEFVEISPGYFRMGSHYLCDRGDLLGRVCAAIGLPWGARPRHNTADPSHSECPLRWTEFEFGFWIARTEVTEGQFRRFARGKPEADRCPATDLPVANICLVQAQRYFTWLEARCGLAVRSPTEAEWECACRAGGSGTFCCGDDEFVLVRYAWFDRNSGGCRHRVASRQANEWGLYDLHGNVWEWCAGGNPGEFRGTAAIRGGGFSDAPNRCRSAVRDDYYSQEVGPDSWDIGFRPSFLISTDDERKAREP